MTFARWLLSQHTRTDDIGELARAAKRDPGFPRNGDYAAVKARVIATMADSDAWAAVGAAEYLWKEAGLSDS